MVSALGPWERVLRGWARDPRIGHPVREKGHYSSEWGDLSSCECHRHSLTFWGTPLLASRTKDLELEEDQTRVLPPAHRAGIPEVGSSGHVCWGGRVRISLGEGIKCLSTYWWNKMLCWGHRPRLCRTSSRLVSMSFPPMSTVPDVGGNRPVRMDLPNTEVSGRKDGL